MERLKEFLADNFIKFEETKDVNILKIGGELFGLAHPKEVFLIDEETGKKKKSKFIFFDKNFNFVGETDCEIKNIDNYVYNFGGQWYYLPIGQEKDVKLNKLRYIGENTLQNKCSSFLGVHGQYELLSGSGNYADWCKKAKFLGVKHFGIVEKNTLAGVLKFQIECTKNDIHPILGMEVSVYKPEEDYTYTVKVYVKNEEGWHNLLTVNKLINCENNKFISEEEFYKLTEGLIVVLDPKTLDYDKWNKYQGVDYYQLDTLEYSKEDRDRWYLNNLKKFANSKLSPVNIADAYYLDKDYAIIRKHLHSLGGTSFYASKNQWFKNIDEVVNELRKITSEDKFKKLFSLANINLENISEECQFTIDISKRHLPEYRMTPEQAKKYKTNEDLFWALISEGLDNHPEYLEKYSEEVLAERIDREVSVIKKGDVIDYFLILWDIVSWCKKNDILTGIGRGSAGGSLVAALLDIVKLDPLKFDLLFERFLNEGRIGYFTDSEMIKVTLEDGTVKEYSPEQWVCNGAKKAKELKVGDNFVY